MTSTWNRAVRAVVDGDLEALRELIASAPQLVRKRSGPPFEAALLHYSAANGVEDELQLSPPNAPAIAQALLDAGAEPDPLGSAYGGGPNATPLCLLVSSWHPHERGVQAELVRVLVGGGAAIDGLQDDGAPLATALTFGYTTAAEALTSCGARVDNVLFAAGLGDLDRVRAYLGESGQPGQAALGSCASVFAPVTIDGPAAILSQALHFAVSHSREEVALELLARGADPNGQAYGHHARTPLLQSLFLHRDRMVDVMLEHGADPLAVDGKLQCNAADYAARTNRPELSRRLRQAGEA